MATQKDKLDAMCMAANDARIGTKLDSIITLLNQLRTNSLYCALSPAGLAIGTSSKKKILITNTTTYLSNGVFKSKTTAETAFTATTMDITNSTTTVQEAVYLVSLDSSGNVTITKGQTTTGSGNAVAPATPTSKTPIGYVRIAVAAGATPFDASSDDLDSAHLTCTYTDICGRTPASAVTALA